MTLVRVYLATTEGPTQVQSIVEEDPEVRSVVCRDGTSESLPISNAYDSFVRKPTGVVERHYGHRVFRMDVSSRISEGRSWQLGVFVAHALKAANRLASKADTPATVLWLTGEVRNDLTVAGVGHIEEKLANSSRLFTELAAAGIEVEAFIPTENGRPDDRVLAALPRTVRLRSVASVGEVCREFGLPDPLGGATTAVEIERPTGVVARGERGGHGPLAMATAVALVLGVPAATLWQGGLWDLWYWEKAGRFRDLGEALILAKDGDCRTCALATQVFQLTRHPHGGTEIGVGMVEHRAPAGGSCAQAVSVEIPPIADRAGVLPPSPVENLCALEYRLRFDGKRAALAWLVTAIGEKRERRLKDMRAQPGETVTVRYTLQAAQRTPGAVDVLAVGSSRESDQVTAWLRTLTTPEQF
ncbi:MAG: hypothetical protein HQL40_21525, partial [Alphaproteobacteria bacterium]|nr:hypothetical protein [Alphaproteobacteria bacterium]